MHRSFAAMKPRTIVLLVVLLVLTVTAIWILDPTSNDQGPQSVPAKPSAGPGGPAGKPLAVTGISVQPQPFTEQITLSGTVLSNEAVMIRPEVAGRVTAIGFKEGQRVQRGHVLVRLFDADLRARLQQTLAQVALDSSSVHRLERIRAVDGISVEELQRATATLAMHRAEADEIRALLEKTVITAPFAGVVGLRKVSVGTVVTPQTDVVLLKDDAQLKLECLVPEKYATMVGVGTTMTFRVRGDNAKAAYRAVVYATDPELDPSSRTLRVRAHVAKAAGLLSGMFADVTLQAAHVPDALLVPTECVVVDINGPKVYVKRGDQAREVRVTTGTRMESDIRITSGLVAGDTVLTTGTLMLKDGLPISVSLRESQQ